MEGAQRLKTLLGALALGGCTLAGGRPGVDPVSPRAEAAVSPVVAAADAGAAGGGRAEPPAPSGNMSEYRQFGETYHVLDTSRGYDERGVASWYGREFHGRRTSSGERYDMNALSAAHRTLPLPSWVEVTNLDNGRRLVVRVNDRGPFHDTDERIIDLSYGAAVRLGIDRTGTARVRVRAVEPWQVRTARGRSK